MGMRMSAICKYRFRSLVLSFMLCTVAAPANPSRYEQAILAGVTGVYGPPCLLFDQLVRARALLFGPAGNDKEEDEPPSHSTSDHGARRFLAAGL